MLEKKEINISKLRCLCKRRHIVLSSNVTNRTIYIPGGINVRNKLLQLLID